MQATERVKQCYLNEDDKAALDCIKDVIATSHEESCRPSIVLLVKEGCEGCQEEKARYHEDISAGRVRLVDINTAEGMEIAQRNDVGWVPAMLIVDCQNQAIDPD